jgi:hypothetical protein
MGFVKNFKAEARDTAKMVHTSAFKINVDSSGMFRAVCPVDLLLHAQNAVGHIRTKLNCDIGLQPKKKHANLDEHDIFYIASNNLKAIEGSLTEAVRLKVTQEESCEVVLALKFRTSFDVMRNKTDGRLMPSSDSIEALPENAGRLHHDWRPEWEHIEDKDGFEWDRAAKSGFRLSIGAGLYLKAAVTSGDQKKVTYARIVNRDKGATSIIKSSDYLSDKAKYDALGPYGKLLVDYDLEPFDSKNTFHRHKTPDIEIPYTEDAARFFYELLLSMANLGLQLEKYIGSTAAINDSIAKFLAGNGLLGLPASVPQKETSE